MLLTFLYANYLQRDMKNSDAKTRNMNIFYIFLLIFVIGMFGYIILNELFWVENAGSQNLNSELFIVLLPGVVIVLTLIIMIYRKNPKKSEIDSEIKVEKQF